MTRFRLMCLYSRDEQQGAFLLGTVKILELYVRWQEGTQIMSKKKLKRNYTKPLPYIKALAKLIGLIGKRKPDWDVFQKVAVAQRLIRRNKRWIQYTD